MQFLPLNASRMREPERRSVAVDARIRVDGAFYEVDPDLAGETVTVWWGLFDHELFVEFQDRRFGPCSPRGDPIPLHRYRKPRKYATQQRADRMGDVARKISVPRAALSGMGDSLAHAADEIASGRLVRPFDVDVPAEFACHLVSPEDSANQPDVAAFRG